jgi:hypothetical protein
MRTPPITDTHPAAPTEAATAPATTTSTPSRRVRWGRRLSVATVAVAALAGSGVAFAGWNVTGSGSGEVQASSAEGLEIVGFVLDTALYPSLTTGATLTVTNPNPFPVLISDVEFGALVISDAGDNCTTELSQVTFTNVSEAELYLAPDATAVEFELADVAAMGAGSNDDCQGATFTAPITLVAESTTLQD